MSATHRDRVRARLTALERAGRRRELTELADARGVRANVGGRPVVVFCSNDYLGLRQHPAVIAAAQAAAADEGAGSGSSRLVAGTLPGHRALEEALADAFGAEAALVFSSGYQANLAVLTTLAEPGDQVHSDALNHASIVDGCRLTRADVAVFDHGDLGGLREALATPCDGHRWVVVEGLYSMDGDRVALPAFAAATAAVGGTLIVDEAHAIGTLGPEGRGACAEAGIDVDGVLRLGTLGKALGAHGAFVLCDADTRALLISGARSFLFTTALPPPAVAAARAALAVAGDEPWRREALARNAARLWEGVRALGFATSPAPSPIVPVIVGGERRTAALGAALLDAGHFARAIRPPTVPADTCRLRLTVSALHDADQIDTLLDALDAGRRAAPLDDDRG